MKRRTTAHEKDRSPAPTRAAPRKRRPARRTSGASGPSVPGTRTGRAPRVPTSRRRRSPGRPKGSVSLTLERQEQIVAFVLSGATPQVAARAAGVNARTFREWMARGEDRHPSRPSSPKLRRFAQSVNQAFGQTILIAQAKAFREQPLQWLKANAPAPEDQDARGGLPGGGGGNETPDALRLLSDAALARETNTLMSSFTEAGTFVAPLCPDPRCPCVWHDNWQNEQAWLDAVDRGASPQRADWDGDDED
jgi:hypothetical protein